MANNKNQTFVVNADNWDEMLGSVGYLLPSNELELLRFNKLYDDYVFKLTNAKVDVKGILAGRYKCQHEPTKIIQINQQEIGELKMVARNGDITIPDDILSKMKAKHRRKDDDGKK